MDEKPQGNNLIALFYIPSFYGAVTWGIWLLLYSMPLINVDVVNDLAMTIFIVTEIFFILSTLITFPHYRKIVIDHIPVSNGITSANDQNSNLKWFLLLLHAVGFLGLIKWITHIAGYMGGLDLVFYALLYAAETIRGDTDLPTTIGIQLAYSGWIATALTVYGVARRQISRKWLFLALLQLAGNFLYIGRTQPVWIMFTSLLMVLAAIRNLSFKKVVIWMISIVLVFILLFWAVAEWSGKTFHEGVFDNPKIPGITQLIYAYGVSGFVYFNHMLVNNESIAYRPERVTYPLNKLLSRFGVVDEPPSQILEFYDVPFETNVGTFLEAFYRDGGMLFILFGVLLYSFGLDFLGLILLRSGEPLALYAWSTLCFTTLTGFITPRIAQFPVWLFLGLGLASFLVKQFHTKIMEVRSCQ